MNLYSKKQRTKMLLFVLASIIIGVSLWYSNLIVTKIRNEERKKVELWSNAIQNKAELVAYTQRLFDLLRTEEKKKVKHWFLATSMLSSDASNDLNQKTLEILTEILSDNTTIPIVMIDEKGEVISEVNIKRSGSPTDEEIAAELALMKKSVSPLEIQYTTNRKQYLYYRDSHVFRELKQVLDDLINNFISETVINSASVPVLFTDSSLQSVVASGNIDSVRFNSEDKLKSLVNEMRSENAPITVQLNNETHYIFYQDSFILTQLKYYPYVQLVAIAIFLLIAYLLFSTFRNAEQNQVWVGMAKETAHQLGTPLSSLLAWKDLLEMKGVDKELLTEMGKDIKRLEVITDRFSKIGAAPELRNNNVHEVIAQSMSYLAPRMPKNVQFKLPNEEPELLAQINIPLFDWVLENLVKNAVDAMAGKGVISISTEKKLTQCVIDVSDTGKGIPARKLKTVFEPGFTTRKRGWGLGLTLVKRIIEEYHGGKIFVKSSEEGKGTTFRILLPLAK